MKNRNNNFMRDVLALAGIMALAAVALWASLKGGIGGSPGAVGSPASEVQVLQSLTAPQRTQTAAEKAAIRETLKSLQAKI